MTTITSLPPHPVGYKRRLRNYLLDSRFQLKYAGLLVAVAVAIAAMMGVVLYHSTRAVVEGSSALVEESRKVSDVSRMNVKDLASDADLQAAFSRESDAHDRVIADQQRALLERQRAMIVSLVGGLALMVLAIGMFGIYFTHKVVGPVFKMKRLLRKVGEGNLRVDEQLRRRDELQDFFDAFTRMVGQLRDIEAGRLRDVEDALAALEGGDAARAGAALRKLQTAMKRAVEP
jgi:methyl-accepting chemotaxis protein